MTRAISAKGNIQYLTTGGEVVTANSSTNSTLCETHVYTTRSEESLKLKQEKEAISKTCGHGKPHDCSNDGFQGAFITDAYELTRKFVKDGIINEFFPTFDNIRVPEMTSANENVTCHECDETPCYWTQYGAQVIQ